MDHGDALLLDATSRRCIKTGKPQVKDDSEVEPGQGTGYRSEQRQPTRRQIQNSDNQNGNKPT